MIEIKHIKNHKFEATNNKETLTIDTDKYSPVEMFITGMGNCSLFDVVEMAKNKGFEISDAKMQIEYKRKDTFPKIFTEFHFIYKFKNNNYLLRARWLQPLFSPHHIHQYQPKFIRICIFSFISHNF